MNLDPRLTRAAEKAVDMVMSEIKGIKASVVSTEDGFEVASRIQNTGEIGRLSAMASSMAALGAIAGEENQLGVCENLVIQAAQGLIVVLQARRSDVTLVLSVVTSRDAIMGQLLYASRQAAKLLEDA